MFKRFALTLALVLGLALPVSAETSGVYAGLKFIDSIQSTGDMSKDRVDVEGFGFGIGSHSQNTVGGGIFVGYDFYPQHQVPIRTEIEYAIRSEMYKSWNKSHPVDEETLNLDAKPARISRHCSLTLIGTFTTVRHLLRIWRRRWSGLHK